MAIIVQKFGGTSVANTDKLLNVCKHVIREISEGNQVVVVVSAQGKKTDELIVEEREITQKAPEREHDVLVSVGEQITASKLCMCLNKQGIPAISLMGWQIPILTNETHGDATILEIKGERILKELSNGKVIVVAGFQGVDNEGNITTLR